MYTQYSTEYYQAAYVENRRVAKMVDHIKEEIFVLQCPHV
jgi:hypothetical protein